jgi:hypothetical protein
MFREPRRNHSRNISAVHHTLENSLRTYASTAIAAGVGLLATARTAEGKVVFTPAHVTISPGSTLKLDLNGDGVVDFTIRNAFTVSSPRRGSARAQFASSGYVAVQPEHVSNLEVEGRSTSNLLHFAEAFPAGAVIGTISQIGNYRQSMAYCHGDGESKRVKAGPWFHATNRYLGLRFVINGQVHFGWARLTVRVSGEGGCVFEALLSGYAYETSVDTPITTGKAVVGPEPTSTGRNGLGSPRRSGANLGLLALGAPGLEAWRQEKRSSERHPS